MSFALTFSWRRFFLAMRDRDCANKNKSAIFSFGVPTKNFAHEMLPPELSRVFRLKRDTVLCPAVCINRFSRFHVEQTQYCVCEKSRDQARTNLLPQFRKHLGIEDQSR